MNIQNKFTGTTQVNNIILNDHDLLKIILRLEICSNYVEIMIMVWVNWEFYTELLNIL